MIRFNYETQTNTVTPLTVTDKKNVLKQKLLHTHNFCLSSTDDFVNSAKVAPIPRVPQPVAVIDQVPLLQFDECSKCIAYCIMIELMKI